ncbi:MAG: hypothetical protein OFPII_36260 [Osedax symbiont Rs1]|nr:MAG: hypothetical protein OFPII_36260 [Osedax symbiont Rs1]
MISLNLDQRLLSGAYALKPRIQVKNNKFNFFDKSLMINHNKSFW